MVFSRISSGICTHGGGIRIYIQHTAMNCEQYQQKTVRGATYFNIKFGSV